MEQQEQQVQHNVTDVAEAGVRKDKKHFSSKMVVGGLVICLIVIGGIMLITNKGKKSVSQPAHKPTTADIAQRKADADRAEREQRQVQGISDDDYVVRDERAEPSNLPLFRGLNTEKPKSSSTPEEERTEEEAINYILRGSAAKAQAQAVAEQSISSTTPVDNRTPPQQNNATRPTSNGGNDDRMPTPMFVYSRNFGGAQFTEPKPGQQAGQTGQSGGNELPTTEELMRMALGLTTPTSAAAPAIEPDFEIQTPATANKQTQLVYTAHPPVVVNEGEILEAALVNRLIVNVEPSPVVCALSRDLFDRSGKYVIFPANSRVIGTAHAVNYRGASRLYVSFHRIILPNGLSVDLPQSQSFFKSYGRNRRYRCCKPCKQALDAAIRRGSHARSFRRDSRTCATEQTNGNGGRPDYRPHKRKLWKNT